MEREFIDKRISIDGRNLPFSIVTARDYLETVGKFDSRDEEGVELWINDNWTLYSLVNSIIALKNAHYLLRRVSYSCGSLADSIYETMEEKEALLHKNFNMDFDFDLIYGKNRITI